MKHRAKIVRRYHYQTGKTNRRVDRRRKALKPGRRVSKSGRRYTETRKNRSDVYKWI